MSRPTYHYLPDAGRRVELGRGPLDALLVEEERVQVAAVADGGGDAAVPVDDAGALVGPHLRHPGQLRVPSEKGAQTFEFS